MLLRLHRNDASNASNSKSGASEVDKERIKEIAAILAKSHTQNIDPNDQMKVGKSIYFTVYADIATSKSFVEIFLTTDEALQTTVNNFSQTRSEAPDAGTHSANNNITFKHFSRANIWDADVKAKVAACCIPLEKLDFKKLSSADAACIFEGLQCLADKRFSH